MRTPIIAGNWKMNKTVAETLDLVREIRQLLGEAPENVEVVLCPPFTSLWVAKNGLGRSKFSLGAQNLYHEPKGAFTGEISPAMLAGLVTYVILGHSERRQYFCETDESVNRKVKAALAHGLKPIVCVGEKLEEYEVGETNEVVGRQTRGGLAELTPEQMANVVIAYEPVWAIGTGKAATGPGANAVVAQAIRGPLAEMFGVEVAQATRVQYGGSVTPANIAEFMAQPNLDGALVGGASLKASDFVEIIKQTAKAKA
jgi:triosephosphate isomerase (TIM)